MEQTHAKTRYTKAMGSYPAKDSTWVLSSEMHFESSGRAESFEAFPGVELDFLQATDSYLGRPDGSSCFGYPTEFAANGTCDSHGVSLRLQTLENLCRSAL
ncbi:Protein of unknown function [Gryllus bimaculatus]|nr:Protein of unknown function [Gryllus bimaculatus]